MSEINPLVIGRATVKMDDGRKFKVTANLTRTPADFFSMYENGSPSCISYSPLGNFSREFLWMRKYKLHCMSHLTHNPHVKGFYIKDEDGETLARSIVFSKKPHTLENMADAKWESAAWYWKDGTILNGRASSHYAIIAQKLAAELGIDLGGCYNTTIFRDNDAGTYHLKYKCQMPPIEIDKKPYFLMPYMDNHTSRFLVTWNEKDKCFDFDCHDDPKKASNYFKLRHFVSNPSPAHKSHQWALSPDDMKSLGYVS